jgi:hypothetical protein
MNINLVDLNLSDIEMIEIVNGLQELRDHLKEKQAIQSPIPPLYYVKRIALIEALILKLDGGITDG